MAIPAIDVPVILTDAYGWTVAGDDRTMRAILGSSESNRTNRHWIVMARLVQDRRQLTERLS
jgi:hypothetical protein